MRMTAPRITALLLVTAGAFITVATLRSAALADQRIGSWVLSCPGRSQHAQSCLLRASTRLLDKAGITGDLEVQSQNGSLVPVITLRGLPTGVLTAAAFAGTADASIRLAGGPVEALHCAATLAGYVCSPNAEAEHRLAAGLLAAPTATLRVAVAVAGMHPFPAQERSLDLSDTKTALSRLQALGPAQVPEPLPPVSDRLIGLADKGLRAAGYRDGVAGLQALLEQHLRK